MKQFVSSIYLKQKTDRKFILVKTTVYPELKAKFTTLTSVKCFLIQNKDKRVKTKDKR